MNWNTFDLNLLLVFEAVMQERNLTRAGRRLGMSQPAVSHALARLRHTLNDELFVRGPDGMQPTPRAQLSRAWSDGWRPWRPQSCWMSSRSACGTCSTSSMTAPSSWR